MCFPLDYFVVQTLDQDIVECVRDYGLWAEQPALADIVSAEDTGNPLKVSETYRPHCMQVKPLTDTVHGGCDSLCEHSGPPAQPSSANWSPGREEDDVNGNVTAGGDGDFKEAVGGGQ